VYRGFHFLAGCGESTRGAGQGEASVCTCRLFCCRVGTGGFMRSGAGAVVEVIVVIAIGCGKGTKASFGVGAVKIWLILLMTRVISSRSLSDCAFRFRRVWDCCFTTSRMLMDYWRTSSNVVLMCWGEEGLGRT